MSKFLKDSDRSKDALGRSKRIPDTQAIPGRTVERDETISQALARDPRRHLPPSLANGMGRLVQADPRLALSTRELDAILQRQGIPQPPDRTADADTGGGIGPDEGNTNLPAVISAAMTKSKAGFNANWHMVRNLPGYIQLGIRQYGKSIFEAFTSSPIEQIQTLSTISNSVTEVKLMMAWIRENGVREDISEVDGSQVFPDYVADVQKWSCMDYSFLLVQDAVGHYVYGWHRDFDHSLDHQQRPCLPGR